jgi:hypothetical protein
MKFITIERDKVSLLRHLRSLLGSGAQLLRPQPAKPVTSPDAADGRRSGATSKFGKRSRAKQR